MKWWELDRLAGAGVPLEVHVSGRTIGLADRDEQDGARHVADLYTLCFAEPSVRGIIWHGFRDGEASAKEGGLRRRALSPKPAYRVLQKLVGVVWHSRAAGQSDATGRFPFRGFRGSYRVGVAAGLDDTRVASFTLAQQAGPATAWVIKVPS